MKELRYKLIGSYTLGEGQVLTCDRCGKATNEDWSSTEKPNLEEVDFCVHCLKYFLDNNISYSFTKKLYGKKSF